NTAIKRNSLNMLVFQAFDFRLDLYLHRNFGGAELKYAWFQLTPFLLHHRRIFLSDSNAKSKSSLRFSAISSSHEISDLSISFSQDGVNMFSPERANARILFKATPHKERL
ncbi:MAG: hypothetical protein IJX24_04050, partial [Oscillospiraceae bacterium]|nr:hypothetical protein [Oscillospiraceae bacterium]